MNNEFNNKKISNEKRRENMEQARSEFGVEVGEDSTKYGEFVSSYFAWIPLPEQKEKAKELQNMTKNDKKQRKE
jgi:hypothetical protein